MAESTEKKILGSVDRMRKGTILFASDFSHLASTDAVNKSFERLVASGKLLRLSKGIYCKPEIDTVLGLGVVYPSLDKIAQAIARRDRSRIIPTGDFALNQLGLSTQVPMNAVYYTDGTPRQIKIYNGRGILFKKAVAKRFAFKNQIMSVLT